VNGSVPCWKTRTHGLAHTSKPQPRPRRLTNQVLAVDRIALALGNVVEELLDIGIEAELPGPVRGYEAVHLHGPVGPHVQVPAVARNDHSGDFVADGVDAADACKP
jgi:hypothetical protein